MSIHCMIVDDEPLAQTILQTYIERVPSLVLTKKCKNAVEASAFLHENSIDLIFLDIKMPQMNGFEFLETLPVKPSIIITTAYSEYALKGYEYSVVDYLLKPFSFDRFMKAVNKLILQPPVSTATVASLLPQSHTVITIVDADNKKIRIDTAMVKYIEGYGNYIKIHYDQNYDLVNCTMQRIEQEFPHGLFIRIHKSYICSIDKITATDKKSVSLGSISLPIGNAYKMFVNDKLSHISH